MRTVAALYVDPRGPYPTLPGVDAWDETRDARGYEGPHPVVAHPPCGPWGLMAKFCYLQDARIAPHAVAQVRRWGGVLEHPVGSRLWTACGLPAPGQPADAWGGVTIRVEQVAWGHPCRKPTLLYLVGCDLAAVLATVRTGGTPTHGISSKARRGALRNPSKETRRRTPAAFAAWLVSLAAGATSPHQIQPAANAPPGLHLVSSSERSRVDLTLDGVRHSLTVQGADHATRARTLALGVRCALGNDSASALEMLEGAQPPRGLTAGENKSTQPTCASFAVVAC